MKLKTIIESILGESPLSNLGKEFLDHRVDRNIMHTHTYQVWSKASSLPSSQSVFIGGLSVKEDAVKYAKAYFETHKEPHQPGFQVYVLRWHDGKLVKKFEAP